MRNRAGGFTLLEMVVALVVFGFLIAGLGQTVRFGLAAWRTEGALTDDKTDLEAVDRTLRLLVGNLAPGGDTGAPPILGNSRSFTGVSRMPVPSLGLSEAPVEIGLALSGNRLILRWRPYLHAETLGRSTPPQEATLVADVARLGISYWQSTGTWTNQWKQPDLPALIRFRIVFKGNTGMDSADPDNTSGGNISGTGTGGGDTGTDTTTGGGTRGPRWPDLVAAPLLSRP